MGTYRIDRTWEENLASGPHFPGPFPHVPETPEKELFGLRVRSRVGIAAGLLLDSKWIECYARLGFDVLTYKTVRSAARPCYPLPNWVFVQADSPLDVTRDQIFRRIEEPSDPSRATSAVCFGMPSVSPDAWRADVARAKGAIGRGQILIVSVVGTPVEGGGEDALTEDYVRCARWAAGAGADVVEANLSCPNVLSAEGSVYQDAALSGRLARALRGALPSTPLLLKAGHFAAEEDSLAFYQAVAGAADGVVLVNGISRRVEDTAGRPVFGAIERVGILGHAIHEPAVRAVERACRGSAAESLGVATVGVGGVTGPDDPGDFFAVGACAVVLGGAPMLAPDLAVRFKERHPEW